MHPALIASLLAPVMFLSPQISPPPGSAPPAGAAQEPPASAENPALAILNAADEATRAVTSVKYHAEFRGAGSLTGRAPVAEGDVIKLRDEEDPDLVMIRGEGWFFTVNQAGRGQVQFIAAFNGQKITRLDPERHRYYESGGGSTDSQVLGGSLNLNMIEYGHPTPFEDEMNALVQILEGQTMVGDVLCDVVYVEYDIEPAQSARWCFGAEDHLPRRVERLQEADGKPGATTLTVTDLEVNPDVDPAVFTLEIPEGYEQGRAGGPVPTSAPMGTGPNR